MRSALLLSLVLFAAAQTLPLLSAAAQEARTMTDRMNARFADKAPRVGDALPDAEGFTAAGEPFALSALRGRLSVLVFGCLT